jgi:hypothetical protein
MRLVSSGLSLALLLASSGLAARQSSRPERFPTFPEFKCDSGMAYCNRAIEAGIHTVKLYGRGSAFADIDGDGWDDLFFANTDDGWEPANCGVSMFYINQRNGRFTPKTAMEMGIDSKDVLSTWNGSFADYDNDGDPDLLLANGGYTGKSNLAFYENKIKEDAGFVSATAKSGIGTLNSLPSTWWGSSWADYDRDGWLDVVVTRTIGTVAIFHNNGNGTFTQVSSLVGINIVMRDGKNPVWIDYDMDGYPDLYLAGMRDHAFYRNDAGKRFINITSDIFPTQLPLLEGWRFAIEPVVFAAAVSDFNQDGLDDLYLGRWSLQEVLLLNDGKGGFTRHTTDWGLITSLEDRPEMGQPFENTMGLAVGDLFDDGYPDIIIGTGNPQRAAPDIVFCNKAGKIFERCTGRILTGADQLWRTRGHGTVFSDFDHDGDSDVAINLGGHPDYDSVEGRISPEWPALFVNEKGTSAKTATLTLVGKASNRDALGARLRVEGSATHYYAVRSMQGFQAQNSKSQVVSLGSKDTAEVEIRWPAGGLQKLTLKAGDRITVTEP